MTRLIISPTDYLLVKNGLTTDDLDDGNYLIMDYPNRYIIPLDMYSQTSSAFLIWCSPLKKETKLMTMMQCPGCNKGYPTFHEEQKSLVAIKDAQERNIASLRKQIKDAYEKLFTKEFTEELAEKIADKVAQRVVRDELKFMDDSKDYRHG